MCCGSSLPRPPAVSSGLVGRTVTVTRDNAELGLPVPARVKLVADVSGDGWTDVYAGVRLSDGEVVEVWNAGAASADEEHPFQYSRGNNPVALR